MTALKGMTFGTMPDRGNRDSVVNWRIIMIKKLEHQRAKALDESYIRIRTDARGRYFLSLFVGAKPIALDEKGSNAVVVANRDELVRTHRGARRDPGARRA